MTDLERLIEKKQNDLSLWSRKTVSVCAWLFCGVAFRVSQRGQQSKEELQSDISHALNGSVT